MSNKILFFVCGVLCAANPKSLEEAAEWSERVQDNTEVIEVGSQVEEDFAIMQSQLGWRFGPSPFEAAETVANTNKRYSSYREITL